MSASDLEQTQHIRSAEYPECGSPQSAAFAWFERVRLNADEGPAREDGVGFVLKGNAGGLFVSGNTNAAQTNLRFLHL